MHIFKIDGYMKKIQNNNDQEYNSERPELLPKHIKTNYNKKKSGEFNL